MGCEFKAVADDTRRVIMKLLSKRKMPAGEIASEFDISKPAVSNHLKILIEAEVVFQTKVRQERIYELNFPKMKEMSEFFGDLADNLVPE